MKPYLVTMTFPMMSSEEPGINNEIEIQEYLERQWCGAAGIFWDVQLDVVELAPVADKATEKASMKQHPSDDEIDAAVDDHRMNSTIAGRSGRPLKEQPSEKVNEQGLTTEDYYDHFVRAQERVAKSVNALLDVAPKWSEEIQKAVFAELEPLLNLADLVDMKQR